MSRIFARNHLSGTPNGLPKLLTSSWQALHTATSALDSDDEVYMTLQNGMEGANVSVQVRIGGTAVMSYFLAAAATAQVLPGLLLRNGYLVEAKIVSGANIYAFGYINEIRPV